MNVRLWDLMAIAMRPHSFAKPGLVDYWRARGWPDLCRPMGVDDFVCD